MHLGQDQLKGLDDTVDSRIVASLLARTGFALGLRVLLEERSRHMGTHAVALPLP